MPFLPKAWGDAFHDWTIKLWPPKKEIVFEAAEGIPIHLQERYRVRVKGDGYFYSACGLAYMGLPTTLRSISKMLEGHAAQLELKRKNQL